MAEWAEASGRARRVQGRGPRTGREGRRGLDLPHAVERAVDRGQEPLLGGDPRPARLAGREVRLEGGRERLAERVLPQRVLVSRAIHRNLGSVVIGASLWASVRRAWKSRDLTVPTGRASRRATSTRSWPSSAASTTTIRSFSESRSTSAHTRPSSSREE